MFTSSHVQLYIHKQIGHYPHLQAYTFPSADLHLIYTFTSAHLHLYIFRSAHLPLHIYTSTHLHIFTSANLHLHICISTHLHTCTSTSSHPHICIAKTCLYLSKNNYYSNTNFKIIFIFNINNIHLKFNV